MEFPLDVILWGIRDVSPLLEILPQKPVGVLIGSTAGAELENKMAHDPTLH